MRYFTLFLLLPCAAGCSDDAGTPSLGGDAGTTAVAGASNGAGTSGSGPSGGSSSGGSGTVGGASGVAGSAAPAGAGGTGGTAGSGGVAGGPAAAAPQVKVMTFNIRYGTAPDGDNAWPLRKPLAFDVFTRQKADLVGVQEALDAQLKDIDGAVPGYARIGVGRDDGATKGEYSAIYYSTARFAVDTSGTFWFSDTPEVPGSTSWGNDITRICSWAHFTEKATGYGLYHFNVHFDHMSQPSREKSAVLLMRRVTERPIADDPVIVTGDFNAGETNLATLYMQGKGMVGGVSNPLPMLDSFRVVHPDETAVLTAHAFNGGDMGAKIDYVYLAAGTTALAAEIDRTNVDGRYPSDHYPVTGTLQLPPEK